LGFLASGLEVVHVTMIALLLVLFAAEDRTFHPVPLAQLAQTKWTHVRVCGTVTLSKHEADGDIHVRLSEGRAFVVAEIVPYHPLTRPKLGQRICVEGISRIDKTHGSWAEIHPVERWSVQPQ
jgi:hypothetical protein